jgi:hypothetical protein
VFGVSKDGKVPTLPGYLVTEWGSTAVWTSEGKGGTNYGESISSAGDINGDGYYDLIVGAPVLVMVKRTKALSLFYYGSPLV